MYSLSPAQKEIHDKAIMLSIQHKNIESELVRILQQVDRLKIYKLLDKNSLFVYATDLLGLDKSVAYALITVARKAMEVPQLLVSINDKSLTLSKASRIVSSLTGENANDLIQFASSHNREEIDIEMARRNPKAKSRDKIKDLSLDLVEMKVTLSRATLQNLKRVQSLEAQKQRETKWASVLDACLEAYLDKNDPVRKATRAEKRKETTETDDKRELWHARVESTTDASENSNNYERIPLSAEQKHAVFLRDQGRCTHANIEGERCNRDRWIDIHHIISIRKGGTNDPENLTTLCSFHHDLVHQLSLPIDGQVTWLRSPTRAYETALYLRTFRLDGGK